VAKWVADPVNPQTRDTWYLRMVVAYWMVKELVAQAVSETRREYVKLLQAIHIMEGKFELFYRAQHGIKFKIN